MASGHETEYGKGDASYQAAGRADGVRRLVDDFYDRMAGDGRFAAIHAMHPADNALSRDKLWRFLCGWLGGPRMYYEKYGGISIPRVHEHLAIRSAERDQWLTCMSEAVAMQAFSPAFKRYLMEQFYVPAEAVRRHRAKIGERTT